jgi:hypothetical protein
MKGLSLTVPIKRSDNDEGKFYLLLLLHLKSIAIHVKGKGACGTRRKKGNNNTSNSSLQG